MRALPSGTVTFLLSDIEGSSSLWERAPDAMRAALAQHDQIAYQVIERHGGVIVKHMGDGCWAAFASAPKAADAAVELQRELQAQQTSLGDGFKVRIGLHTGEVDPTEGDYFGPVPNRGSRVASLANGDQIVCSAATAGLLGAMQLRNEGLHQLRGIGVEEIFMVLADGLIVDDRPLRSPVTPSNLPRTRTSFVGRRVELARTVGFVRAGHDVVTLIGPGGIGKSRLAIEAGGELAASMRGVVHFCELAPIAGGEAIASTVAEVVGARQQQGMDLIESIADYLSASRTVLILDSCEHVIEAARELVERLVDLADVGFLITSREALGVDGEQLVPISPLPIDGSGVELFVDRARQQDPAFQLSADVEVHVRDVVRRLDGIPLAIELAAARIRVMTPAELAERLDDRFQLLGGRRRERHETLRDTVAWSFRLLSPAEAALFTRLSVFAGGFGIDSVEEVCSDDELVVAEMIPDLLLALVDKSMVVSQAQAGHTRFHLLETLRRFAEEELAQLGSGHDFRHRHADHFRALAGIQNARIFSAAEPDAWRILDLEWSNLRTAFDTYRADGTAGGGVERAAEIVVALVWFAALSMRYESFGWASDLLGEPGIEDSPSYVSLCGAAAFGAYFTVSGEAMSFAESGLAADPTDPQGFCRTALAAVFLNNLHTPEASDALTSAWLASGPTTPGSRMWAEAFRTLHLVTHHPTPEALDHAAASARLARETGSISATAIASWSRGLVELMRDRSQAIATWNDALEWPRSMPGDHLVEQMLVGLILNFTVKRDDLVRTLERCRDAIESALEAHYHVGTSHLFGVAAIALTRAGDPVTGARLVGSMISRGHLPRPNATQALEAALGEGLEAELALGGLLGLTEAAHLAIDALDRALVRVPNTAAASRDD